MTADEARDPLARVVAVSVVVATLATAFVSYRAAAASRADDRAAADAQRLAVQAMEQTVLGQQRAHLAYGTFSLAERQRRRAGSATREALFRPAAERRRAVLERERWQRAARRTQQLTPVTVDGPTGPRADPRFPNRLLVQHNREAFLSTALQDAADEESVGWDSRGTTYASILTMLAVALFLLGFTLSVPGGARLVFVGTGIVLALVGAFRAVRLEISLPERAPDAAAAAFADAEVAWATEAGPADARQAVQKYTEAIRLRPSFARAYYRRANAEFVAGAPELGGTFLSTTSDESLERSIADLEKAAELGLESSRLFASLGADKFLRGMREDDDDLLRSAVDHARKAIALEPDEAFIRSNLAVALLALGEVEEARREFRTYLRYALFRDGDRENARSADLVEEVVAGTLSDLEIIHLHRPHLAGEARRAKELVVGSASRGEVGTGSWTGSLGKPVAEVLSNAVLVSDFRLEGFDFARDKLSIQWYGRGGESDPWVAMPQVSGNVAVQQGGWGPGELEQETGGLYFIHRRYLFLVEECPPPGDYRVELFVNGQLVASSTKTAEFGRFDELNLRSVDMWVCVPNDWREDRRRRVPGVLEGATSPDRSKGLYVVRVADAERLFDVDPRSDVSGVLERVLRRFPLAPGRLRYSERAGSYFLGLEAEQLSWYEYGRDGLAIVGAGVDDNGDFLVGLVYGPRPYWTGEPSRIADSLTRDE